MRIRTHISIILVLIFVLSLTVTAQGSQNLLENPGFEAPFVDRGGSPVRRVANGWQPWHFPPTANMPSGRNAQPEYQETAPDAARIRSGNNAQQYFNNDWRTHEGGVFQRVVGITPGTELRFSVYAWVWSSSFSERDQSEQPGDVTVQVGIDPTGGTDPASNNIVWSLAVEQYDAYREYATTARATSNAVTVYVRTSVGFPVQNTYTYLDDSVLAPTVDDTEPTDPPPATNTPVPPPTNTSVPPPTNTPSDDPTPTQETGDIPTSTPQPVVPTNTPQPVVPTDTPQPVVPTNTPQPVAPTNTPPATGGQFPTSVSHVVNRGDTVSRLADLYGSTIEAIKQANGLDDRALIYVGQQLTIPVPISQLPTATTIVLPTAVPPLPTQVPPTQVAVQATYTIVRGDTLTSIAERFGTTVLELAQFNGITNPNVIKAGQVLQIPGQPVVPPQVVPPPVQQMYVVQPGDTLYRISVRFGVSMWTLAQVNGIYNVNLIFAGQTLLIP